MIDTPRSAASGTQPLLTILIAACVALIGVLAVYVSWHVSSRIDQSLKGLGVIPPTAAETAARVAKEKDEAEAAITALKNISDYSRGVWHPIHFKPAIDAATNEHCLTCHQEILTRKVRETSPAGLEAAKSIAWYQTLDTYDGEQTTFHARHLTSAFAKSVMNLQCTFCHQGHDVREEAPNSSATAQTSGFALRKVVDPSKSCLLCHGSFPGESMGFDKTQPWHKMREDMESADTPNACLTCHAEQFRTVRHQVSYLKADAIEAHAKKGSSDTCYGCHGGRAWYRISYPYPRHPWPGMDKSIPDWAKDRPTESDARYRIKQ